MITPNLIEDKILEAGAYRVKFANAHTINPAVASQFNQWLQAGFHAGMDYLHKHASMRTGFDNLLPNTSTVICMAFNYFSLYPYPPHFPYTAKYALGQDYHKVIKQRLRNVVALIKQAGYKARICVDSAPVAERYWAIRSGLGFPGLNGAIIIPGAGSYFFLAEILTTLPLPPSPPEKNMPSICLKCKKCIKACPTGALMENATIDSRKCISYLTIEHKGNFSDSEKKYISLSKRKHLFGCDECISSCPYNASHPITLIPEFYPSNQLLSFIESIHNANNSNYLAPLPTNSPLQRAGLENLIRNLKISEH